MKQYITLEQGSELGYFKLCDILYDETKSTIEKKFYIEHVDEMTDGNKNSFLENLTRQFTIGKMIEILINLDYKPLIDTSVLLCDVSIFKDDLDKGFDSLELCDALWECLKYVINA